MTLLYRLSADVYSMSIGALYRFRRSLIENEPSTEHTLLTCSAPATCPECRAWVAWARTLSRVDNELMRRERAEQKK